MTFFLPLPSSLLKLPNNPAGARWINLSDLIGFVLYEVKFPQKEPVGRGVHVYFFLVPEEGWFGQPKYGTNMNSTSYWFLLKTFYNHRGRNFVAFVLLLLVLTAEIPGIFFLNHAFNMPRNLLNTEMLG